MSLSDSYKKYGAKPIKYHPESVMEAVAMVLKILNQRGEHRVITLAVAGILVKMQAELAGDTVDDTIDLMRAFLDTVRILPEVDKN